MFQRIERANGVVFYRSTLLGNAPHGFSTRIGGVSGGVFESLNLGNPSGVSENDPAKNLAENYRRLLIAIGCGGRKLLRVHQIHGKRVLWMDRNSPMDEEKADGILTEDAGAAASGACDAAARSHDLHVGRAADAQFELGRAVAGPGEMRMRIYEAGHDRTAGCIQRRARLHRRTQVIALAYGDNLPTGNGDRAIRDDAQVAHRRPTPRPRRPGQRHQLADVVDEKISLHGIQSMRSAKDQRLKSRVPSGR